MKQELPETIDQLWYVTLQPNEKNTIYEGERFGEVQTEATFPSTALTALTEFMVVNDRKYPLFISKQGHYYIVVTYALV